MQNATAGIQKIILTKLFHESSQVCPACNSKLFECNKKASDTGKYAVICPNCYYPQKAIDFAGNAMTNKQTLRMVRHDSIKFLTYYSYMLDGSILNGTFDSYIPANELEESTKQRAIKISFEMAQNTMARTYISGQTGTGKSHLASAIMQKILDQRDYHIDSLPYKPLFISWTSYLDLAKKAKYDNDKRKKFDDLLFEIKKSNLVLLDDLGAEVTSENAGKDEASMILTDLLNMVVTKNLIVTSNYSTSGIKKIYGDRVHSRLRENGLQGFTTSGIKDHRL